VPIFQHEWEFSTLLRLYKQRKPKRVLEIGTYHGGTLYHWLKAATPEVVVQVDSFAMGVDNREEFPKWKKAKTQLHCIAADSTDPDTTRLVEPYGPFDWIWIDAGHYDHEVRADWANYGHLAAPGAVACFHDILTHPNHPEIQVEPLWREIQAQGYLTQELVANPQADWGGIGVVYLP
jgi:predicted O-methyltransferase YrrM